MEPDLSHSRAAKVSSYQPIPTEFTVNTRYFFIPNTLSSLVIRKNDSGSKWEVQFEGIEMNAKHCGSILRTLITCCKALCPMPPPKMTKRQASSVDLMSHGTNQGQDCTVNNITSRVMKIQLVLHVPIGNFLARSWPLNF